MNNFLKSLGLYLRTISHLKAVQIINRVRKKFIQRKPRLIKTPKLSKFKPIILWPSKKQSILGNSTFSFLNTKRKLNFPEDWDNKNIPLLWNYNLHYFDGILSDKTDDYFKINYINQWIIDNSKITGVAWDPYPISLRIVNWIKWRWSCDQKIENFDASLADQTNQLFNNIEYHLLGNHLLENAKALIFAGCYFEGSEPTKWLKKGIEIIEKEIPEQILDDGGHFELSPMYHSIMFELVLDLLTLSHKTNAPTLIKDKKPLLSNCANRMHQWLISMTHPDGEISFFNDSSTNTALAPNILGEYINNFNKKTIKPHTKGITHLSNSGYLRFENKNAVLLIDIAEIGPSYLPGHGHADALSIEFSLFKQRVFVNLGTSEYGNSPMRHFERSTAAHSTLELNHESSSEIWSGFRVGRRAKVFNVDIKSDINKHELSATHNGYRYLPGRPNHTRHTILSEGELKRSLKAGISPKKIVFSGVGKSAEEIKFAIEKNILQINVESEEELKLIEGIAKKLKKKVNIGIRINPNIDAKTHKKITTGREEDKFGLDFRASGFPDELTDNENEENGYEI